MTRLFASPPVAVMVCMAGIVSSAPASAQAPVFGAAPPISQIASVAQTDVRGTVLDERGHPLSGVVVSALGSSSAFAVSDREGRFTLRDLSAGPYLIRAHLQGYVPARGRIVQVTAATREISIALTRVREAESPQVLQAGIGAAEGVDGGPSADPDAADHSELAWRLRHLRRSVL